MTGFEVRYARQDPFAGGRLSPQAGTVNVHGREMLKKICGFVSSRTFQRSPMAIPWLVCHGQNWTRKKKRENSGHYPVVRWHSRCQPGGPLPAPWWVGKAKARVNLRKPRSVFSASAQWVGRLAPTCQQIASLLMKWYFPLILILRPPRRAVDSRAA